MNQLHRHSRWIVLGLLAVALLGGVLPLLNRRYAEAQQALLQQREQNAVMLKEARALQQDVAEEARLRRQLGEKTYRSLFAPPARAAMVAELRQIGLETGLRNFGLTMAESTWLPSSGSARPPEENLTATTLRIKASAPDDRSIYTFAYRALEQLPGYLKLDRLSVQRLGGTALSPTVIQAELDLRWLSLNEELLFARQQP